jgi:hypothetical protein
LRESVIIGPMLTDDQLAAAGKVLTAYSWLQGNVGFALLGLLETDVETTTVILNNLPLADRVRVAVQLLDRQANRKKISTSAFQGLDAALRRAFDLLAVPLVLPGLTFDANSYAENKNDDWSGFNLDAASNEIAEMASAYLQAAAGLLGAVCVYRQELQNIDGTEPQIVLP